MGKTKNQCLLGAYLALLSLTSCYSSTTNTSSPNINTNTDIIEPSTINSSVITPIENKLPVTPNLNANIKDRDYYQEAVIKAEAAKVISDSAVSSEDWLLVANQLEDSVKLLKSVPKSHPKHGLANKILPQYQESLRVAKNKANKFQGKQKPTPLSTTPLTIAPETIAVKSGTHNSNDHFTIPIKNKLGGIPVIEVIFNDSFKVLMLLDTGASRSLINQEMAKKMNLPITGSAVARTANGMGNFEISVINNIKFGNGMVKNLEIAIGQNDLPYGLLGHDVYDGYDITLREKTIEFIKRK